MRPETAAMLAGIVQDLGKIVADFGNPNLLAQMPRDQVDAVKEFAASAEPLVAGAGREGLTNGPTYELLRRMKHLRLFVKGGIWQSTGVPGFFEVQRRLADALEHGLVPGQRSVKA